jgi:hypothetical protein
MPETVAPSTGTAISIVVFDTVTYDVIAGPDDATPLVQVARENILQSIEIDKLVRNLNRTDDLLHIAACGVAGFVMPETKKSLSAQVMGLQAKVRHSTGEMEAALLKFGKSAESMFPILRGAFKDLYSLYEADCLERPRNAEVATKWPRLEAPKAPSMGC